MGHSLVAGGPRWHLYIVAIATIACFAQVQSTALSVAAEPVKKLRSKEKVDGYNDSDGSIVDLCECSCCYEVAPGRKQCIQSPKMDYEVSACDQCDVQGCSKKFTHVCSDVSVVKATCIKRRGWIFEVVPFLFLSTAVVLIIYGVSTRRPIPPRHRYEEIAAHEKERDSIVSARITSTYAAINAPVRSDNVADDGAL